MLTSKEKLDSFNCDMQKISEKHNALIIGGICQEKIESGITVPSVICCKGMSPYTALQVLNILIKEMKEYSVDLVTRAFKVENEKKN